MLFQALIKAINLITFPSETSTESFRWKNMSVKRVGVSTFSSKMCEFVLRILKQGRMRERKILITFFDYK